MKTVKRIFAIILFIVVAALVGYLFHTGSRLSSISGTENVKQIIRSVLYDQTQKNI